MKEENRKALELFIEKAREIKSLSFNRFVEQEEMCIQISGDSSGSITGFDYRLPSQEAVNALILVFRFFIQDRDEISLHCLSEWVFTDSAVSDGWKEKFKAARKEFKVCLSEYSLHALEIDGISFTRGDIMFAILQMDFYETLLFVLPVIEHIAYWSEQELKAL